MSSVDELLETARSETESGLVPASQIAVAREGEIVAFETFGDAMPESRFPIYSATKPIVASAMWLLIGDGHVDAQRRVVEYIPEFGTHGKHVVTIEQVMLHTAGFPSPLLRDAGADPEKRREHFRDWELEWEPGSKFEYHPLSAHWVLADLIGRISGSDFRDFIEQRVIEPLGLPRVLGLTEDRQRERVDAVAVGDDAVLGDFERSINEPATRAAGIPGGGAYMTAAELARFYQGLLHNPGALWDAAILADVKTNVRCNFDDPMLGVPVQRTLGLVCAGDDGKHQLRYAIFGADCSPGSFGHAGANAQVGWADPASGISFAYLTNGVDIDVMRAALRSNRLSTLASALEL